MTVAPAPMLTTGLRSRSASRLLTAQHPAIAAAVQATPAITGARRDRRMSVPPEMELPGMQRCKKRARAAEIAPAPECARQGRELAAHTAAGLPPAARRQPHTSPTQNR